jgi:hypothetical protein
VLYARASACLAKPAFGNNNHSNMAAGTSYLRN